jgi:hypothetical protein
MQASERKITLKKEATSRPAGCSRGAGAVCAGAGHAGAVWWPVRSVVLHGGPDISVYYFM